MSTPMAEIQIEIKQPQDHNKVQKKVKVIQIKRHN